MILGIDEVGRGPWAGPLVVGAVVLGGRVIDGLTDSKRLSKKRREELDVQIRDQAAAYGLGWVSASELDEVGLAEALRLATRRAVEQIHAPYHEIIIDGTINFLSDTAKGQYVTTIKKADLLIPSVSAASIVAKVARDRYMAEQDTVYEGYRFAQHAGYGTAVHRNAIEQFGVTPQHRLSFAPLQKYAPEGHRSAEPIVGQRPTRRLNKITTKQIGDLAEDEAMRYLLHAGHTILVRNWKTKLCEIDIISSRLDKIYFTEVKYRKTANQGGGLVAITRKKLGQMQFAANYYLQVSKMQNNDAVLMAISLTGSPPEVEECIELI